MNALLTAFLLAGSLLMTASTPVSMMNIDPNTTTVKCPDGSVRTIDGDRGDAIEHRIHGHRHEHRNYDSPRKQEHKGNQRENSAVSALLLMKINDDREASDMQPLTSDAELAKDAKKSAKKLAETQQEFIADDDKRIVLVTDKNTVEDIHSEIMLDEKNRSKALNENYSKVGVAVMHDKDNDKSIIVADFE